VEPGELAIDPDIRRARTPPRELYGDARWFEAQRERVWRRGWSLVGHAGELAAPLARRPLVLLPGLLDEPVLLTRDAGGRLHALANACTHRGMLVCEEAPAGPAPAPAPAPADVLRCRYHGRRFALDGRFLSMPNFEDAVDFPTAADDLPRLPLGEWRGFLFVSPRPAMPFTELVAELDAATAWLPVERAVFDPARSRDYEVQAHWALYLDNFLEGFHVGFVHPSLAPALDLADYTHHLHRWSSVQVAAAPAGAREDELLVPPPGAPHAGRRVAGYFFWLAPGTMVNVYPWGLSLNLVQPLTPDRTRIAFRTWVWDERRLGRGAGADLHQVELEDEAVVQAVQRGLRSSAWTRGRYAPRHEVCVHHFHRLLASLLADPPRA
jgi:choline monooxygenase